MNKLFELVLHEVERQYRSERAFYHTTLGITQRAWEKYKNGETDFSNIKLSTYERMVGLLFTAYEIMLIDKAIEATNLNKYDNVIEAFHQIKVEHAKVMLERGATIENEGAFHEDGVITKKAITKIRIVDELNRDNINIVTFQIKIPSQLPGDRHLRMPSGRNNRREWFNKYFDEVVVV